MKDWRGQDTDAEGNLNPDQKKKFQVRCRSFLDLARNKKEKLPTIVTTPSSVALVATRAVAIAS